MLRLRVDALLLGFVQMAGCMRWSHLGSSMQTAHASIHSCVLPLLGPQMARQAAWPAMWGPGSAAGRCMARLAHLRLQCHAPTASC